MHLLQWFSFFVDLPGPTNEFSMKTHTHTKRLMHHWCSWSYKVVESAKKKHEHISVWLSSDIKQEFHVYLELKNILGEIKTEENQVEILYLKVFCDQTVSNVTYYMIWILIHISDQTVMNFLLKVLSL